MSSWRERADEARKQAKKTADAETEQELETVLGKADELEQIGKELKLADEATYNQLITIVEKATARNESIASVVKRLKALGEAGAKLASAVGTVSGAGALKSVLEALDEPS